MSVYPPDVEVRRSAAISGDGLYRYNLTREWCPERQLRIRMVTFVMLNPSTADADQDDPTIRRCVGFARCLGYDGIRVANLYAFRATKPAELWLAPDPTGGQRNDDLLAELGRLSRYGDPLVAAWGAHAQPDRVDHVRHLPGWENLQALGVTKHGAPRHPLYLPSTATPFPWPIPPNGAL